MSDPATDNMGVAGHEFSLTNPSYAEYLQTTTGKIIAEQAQRIIVLTAKVERLEKALRFLCDDLAYEDANKGRIDHWSGRGSYQNARGLLKDSLATGERE